MEKRIGMNPRKPHATSQPSAGVHAHPGLFNPRRVTRRKLQTPGNAEEHTGRQLQERMMCMSLLVDMAPIRPT